jgi:hypothetical protein
MQLLGLDITSPLYADCIEVVEGGVENFQEPLVLRSQYPILQNYQWVDRAIASFEAMR